MKKRDLDPEEAALWREHTQSDKKLRKNAKPIVPSQIRTASFQALKPAPNPEKIPISKRDTAPLPFLAPGELSGMDGNSAARMRKGVHSPDAILDLHGMTQAEAHSAFLAFIRTCYDVGKRRLLVITGKGARGEGVLRRSLPEWVNEGAVRSLIVAYDKAPPRLGGEGAFAILLKKKRFA